LWAAEHGLKFTHIELDAGETPSQPMVTYHGHGTLTGELAVARERSEALAAAGFPVLRTKIEAAPADHGVPADRAAAGVVLLRAPRQAAAAGRRRPGRAGRPGGAALRPALPQRAQG